MPRRANAPKQIVELVAQSQQGRHGQVVSTMQAQAPPFLGTRPDARRPQPRLTILDWSSSRRVGVRRQIACTRSNPVRAFAPPA
jgi:hypothetical protein